MSELKINFTFERFDILYYTCLIIVTNVLVMKVNKLSHAPLSFFIHPFVFNFYSETLSDAFKPKTQTCIRDLVFDHRWE